MRMTREEREHKFRNVWASRDIYRIETFMRELMQDLIAADSDIQQMILRGERASALPLQRTLPDEQFKGVVVEAIGGAQGELVKRITDYLSSGGLFNPEMALHDRVRQLLIDCRELLAASPAGRAEQEQ